MDFGIKDNEDFPDIVLFSVAVPDFISNRENQKLALKILKQKVHNANKIHLTCLSIVCNTAHLLLPQLQKETNIPFISMIDEVALVVKHLQVQKVGLLGNPTTLRSNLYQKALGKYCIEVILPNRNQLPTLESVIRNIIGGKQSKQDQYNLISVAQSLQDKRVEAIILGCTELPIAFPKVFGLPVLNSVEILADALLNDFYKKR